MNDNRQQRMELRHADAVAVEWLDEPRVGDRDAALNMLQRTRVADQQLLHALLEFDAGHYRATTKSNIERVLAAISASEGAAQPTAGGTAWTPSRRFGFLNAWLPVLAASLLVAVSALFYWSFSPRHQAHATVNEAYAASLLPVDRTYEVDAEFGGVLPSVSHGTLYVRGGENFVIRKPLSAGSEVLIGTDGETAWLVPTIGPVLVRDDPTALKEWLALGGKEMPMLRIDKLLLRMATYYRVESLPATELADGQVWQHVRGTRRGEITSGPEVMEIWTDPQTGVVQRKEMRWASSRVFPRLVRVTLVLESDEPLPADWYQHTHHHEATRPVLHVPHPPALLD